MDIMANINATDQVWNYDDIALDKINQRWGKGALTIRSVPSVKAKRGCGIKQESRTLGYTTSWEEIPVGRA